MGQAGEHGTLQPACLQGPVQGKQLLADSLQLGLEGCHLLAAGAAVASPKTLGLAVICSLRHSSWSQTLFSAIAQQEGLVAAQTLTISEPSAPCSLAAPWLPWAAGQIACALSASTGVI